MKRPTFTCECGLILGCANTHVAFQCPGCLRHWQALRYQAIPVQVLPCYRGGAYPHVDLSKRIA